MSVTAIASPVWHALGASVRGPAHRKAGEANQDAWLRWSGRAGALVVVCDGVGSRPLARRGAQAACRAVKEAVNIWSRADGAAPQLLLRLIHVLWTLRIAPALPGECVTTCLFALALSDGRLLLAQLGDGLVALHHPTGDVELLAGDRPGFANQTTGLGAAKEVGEWSWRLYSEVPPDTAVLLATDGVSDDLHQERLGELVSYMVSQYGNLPPSERWRQLNRELTAWPTPHHLDDKTLAMLWQSRGN